MQPSDDSGVVSVRVLVVLFNNEVDQVAQLVDALVSSVSVSIQSGTVSHAELAFGDCSETPCLSESEQLAIIANAENNGFSRATYEFFDENLGTAGGNSRLAEEATTDMLLILNPDTYPSPWMLEHQVEAFHGTIGAVEARQLPVEHPKAYDPNTKDVSWASGACTMVKRSAYEDVGGHDTEHFFLHCDDVDLSWRLKLNGYRVVIEPSALVLHHKPLHVAGGIQVPEVERYYGVLGRLMLASRYGGDTMAAESIKWIRSNGDRVQNQAVDDYLERADENRVPEPIPDGPTVAQFVGSEYAIHRF